MWRQIFMWRPEVTSLMALQLILEVSSNTVWITMFTGCKNIINDCGINAD